MHRGVTKQQRGDCLWMRLAAVLCGCALSAACMPRAAASFESAEPAARNAAIVQAARQGDKQSIPALVRMLSSDDPATRVLAIRTLEKLTGQTHGFDASASDESRARGIEQWQAWLAQQSANDTGSISRGQAHDRSHQ